MSKCCRSWSECCGRETWCSNHCTLLMELHLDSSTGRQRVESGLIFCDLDTYTLDYGCLWHESRRRGTSRSNHCVLPMTEHLKYKTLTVLMIFGLHELGFQLSVSPKIRASPVLVEEEKSRWKSFDNSYFSRHQLASRHLPLITRSRHPSLITGVCHLGKAVSVAVA